MQTQHKYTPQNMFAMDETACWMDMPSDTTVAVTGSRSVPLKTSGHEKNHFTVILTAKADGTKMKPYVVFKGKGTQLIKDLQNIPGIVVRFSANGWMNDALTVDYLHSIIGALSFSKRLLVWDAYRAAKSPAFAGDLPVFVILGAYLPGSRLDTSISRFCMAYLQSYSSQLS